MIDQLPTPPIFREAAMRRLAATGQIDSGVALISPGRCFVLAATIVICLCVCAWAWKGAVLRIVSAEGILAHPGGVFGVDAPDAGQVIVIEVKPGDRVSAGQVLAKTANPLLAEQLRLAQDALVAAEREAQQSGFSRAAATRLEEEAVDRRRQDLEHEIADLEGQIPFATEYAGNQQTLFEEGLGTKSAAVAARQRLVDVRSEIARRRTQYMQLGLDRFRSGASLEAAAAESRVRIAGLARGVEELRSKLAQSSTVVAPRDGQVVEIKSYAGAMVGPGTPIAALQPIDSPLEAVVYVPAQLAKRIEVGMEAQLAPGNTRPAEDGFLRGTVVSISQFPVSPVAVLRRFENEALTTSITARGPVTELRIGLRPDPTDASGYAWSSRRRARPAISTGGFCSARIVLGRERPAALVAPWLKEMVGVN